MRRGRSPGAEEELTNQSFARFQSSSVPFPLVLAKIAGFMGCLRQKMHQAKIAKVNARRCVSQAHRQTDPCSSGRAQGGIYEFVYGIRDVLLRATRLQPANRHQCHTGHENVPFHVIHVRICSFKRSDGLSHVLQQRDAQGNVATM